MSREAVDQKALLQAAKAQVATVMDNAIAEMENVEPGEDDVFYVEPIQDPYQKAISYLEKHNILQLFQVKSSHSATVEKKLQKMKYELNVMQESRHMVFSMWHFTTKFTFAFQWENLTASIVYTKPDKPLEFMMHEVEKIKKLQNKNKEIKK